ncbi:hypothetical protein EN828_22195 [Mesorhizobium sp. M2D.F.Ca.ET.185.01.1.1]|uniref:hypothetical protein n=1 Tax=unclassified Mesorhizobium TaxID=325217 RepID=UPI000FCB1B22|nr:MULTISPECIES: hypothetical protein [unclassified Mesorhizobium]TGP76911.1 hypothetical protein EN870_19985 [bacterium M00.F.Ca.ET.227.01.1.1]TGP84960.1 hypothetical protein EN864_28750 [bacterium M00.F.Ca.ET.221.01.1.1]TGP88530.1 hypothetical protein EN865_28050 [bacterium M00.F.Ca.ET.222.01.1.1]TGU04668.1 hypothetical protein EN806_38850 [bacterium M00.F.Ca.ET.163.01.1.1]TGU30658.1 hypothetical protein EN799_30050 [bacterium M00.F.Ca.ET.156.01.1.1]TGU44915.1 hypothetical protein EN789_198
MAKYKETLQRIWHQYENEHGHVPASTREAVQWGVSRGMIQAPEVDPLAKLVEDMSDALREEYAIDAEGRRYRVNHAVRVTRAGVQYTLWGVMKDAPREHMQKAFIQRREQIVGDCVQLATDVDAYNAMKTDQPRIQMVFDFRDDIAERFALDEPRAA